MKTRIHTPQGQLIVALHPDQTMKELREAMINQQASRGHDQIEYKLKFNGRYLEDEQSKQTLAELGMIKEPIEITAELLELKDAKCDNLSTDQFSQSLHQVQAIIVGQVRKEDKKESQIEQTKPVTLLVLETTIEPTFIEEKLMHSNSLVSLILKGIWHGGRYRFNYQDVEVLEKVLKNNRTLTQLDLSYNNMIREDKRGMQAIANIVNGDNVLKKLYLKGLGINDEDIGVLADPIKNNASLTELSLRTNAIHAAGAGVLAKALSENKSLTVLMLGDNHIRHAGAGHFADYLKQNTRLKKLDICYNEINFKGVIAIADALKENQDLEHLDIEHSGTTATHADESVNDPRWIQMIQSFAEMLKINRGLTSLCITHLYINSKDNLNCLMMAVAENYYLINLLFDRFAELCLDFRGDKAENYALAPSLDAITARNKDRIRHCYNQEYSLIAHSIWKERGIIPPIRFIIDGYLGEPSSTVSAADMYTFFKSRSLMVSPKLNQLLEPIRLYSESKDFWGRPKQYCESAMRILDCLSPLLNNYLLLSTAPKPLSGIETMRLIEETIKTAVDTVNDSNEFFVKVLKQALLNIKKEFPLQGATVVLSK